MKRPTSEAVDALSLSCQSVAVSGSTASPPVLVDVYPTMSNAHTESNPTDQYGPVDPESVSVPTELSSDGTKLVYLYLQLTGESTLTELNQSLEMKSISLLPILEALVDRDLVSREGSTYLPTAA